MKNFKFITITILSLFLATSCSDDDDNITIPVPVNEEELITTVNVTLTPNGGGTAITFQMQDLDGDGPNNPVFTYPDDLTNAVLDAGVTYNGEIQLLNETEDPAEDITEEVEEEDDEHQFFYTASSSLDLTTEYANFDGDNNPLGTEFTVTTGAASTGTLTFTLRHEPTKPNTGLSDAGGETDVEVAFSIEIQ
ncbi:hypothetical protein CLV86_0190 [Lacinutrix venerupis]|uniref:type 1 periplasmic binding fold superfamily protein n=1 Tax=Lacinutrix venerupis TaxID=1486034 RepID=UPI000EAE55C5|nr:type 1 periplasmic binding fold superfamily protein [Lacinutrix venerupis]RLJ68801.1 hypothetical protein CLV86_0190 [Lacinutrix venerupis]